MMHPARKAYVEEDSQVSHPFALQFFVAMFTLDLKGLDCSGFAGLPRDETDDYG
jgi:hypothetical protein